MLKNLFTSIALLALLTGCDGPTVVLLGPFSMTPKAAPVYRTMEIPFCAIIMAANRKHDFVRDSVVVGALLPSGFIVNSIDLAVLPLDMASTMEYYEKNDTMKAKFDSIGRIIDAAGRNQAQMEDSLARPFALSLLPELMGTERAPECDGFLSDTGRRLQAFRGRIPVSLTATDTGHNVCIVGRIRMTANRPGRFKVGYFMTLDNAATLNRDTTKKIDTVLSSFVDEDSIVVTGEGITLIAQDAQYLPQLMASNPMNVQGGIISFLLPENSRGPSEISLYDVAGRPIFSEPMTGQSGLRRLVMDRLLRRPLVTGFYILKLTADSKTVTRPITVVK